MTAVAVLGGRAHKIWKYSLIISPSETLAVGRDVRLSVTDTGVGIPADVFPNVLKPFFTTKGQNRGTGIGLATVQQTAAAANGEIAIASTVGTGTCVDVFFPVEA